MFEKLSEKMEIKLVQGKGNFNGGACRCNEQDYIIVNKSKPIEQRLNIIAEAFTKRDLSDVYLVPVLRSFIEEKN